MEDFSQFIHEEIFLVGETPVKTKPQESLADSPTTKNDPAPVAIVEEPKVQEATHKVGIVSGENSVEEEALLSAILGAVKVNPVQVIRASKPDVRSEFWIDFSPRPDGQYFQVEKTSFGQVVPSCPLSELTVSKEQKGKLWLILKAHFDI